MRLIDLTKKEREELTSAHRCQGGNSKAADKIKAILLLADGYSRREVSHILLRDEDTIGRWRDDYKRRKSLSDWLNEDYPGYPG